MSKNTRRAVAVLLAVTLTIGLTIHAARAAAMDVEMASAATNSDMAMPDKCDGCADGKDRMSLGTCAAYCNSMTALPSAIIIPIEVGLIVMPPPVSGRDRSGHGPPPDPHPPKVTAVI